MSSIALIRVPGLHFGALAAVFEVLLKLDACEGSPVLGQGRVLGILSNVELESFEIGVARTGE